MPRPWAELMRLLIPVAHRDAAMGDLEEEFALRTARDGPAKARRWLRRQVWRSIRPAASRGMEALRDGWTNKEKEEVMTMWLNDLRLAMRVLAKRPGFTGTIVLTLALGIGTTTALFGIFRGVFLDPLPLPDSDELVVVMGRGAFGCCGPASGPDYADWVARQRSFDGLAALNPGTWTLTDLDEPERVYGTRVTASAFDFLGVEPMLGRALRLEDEVSGDAVVLSHRLWSRIYEGRPDAVGRAIELDGVPLTIVGVMPESFDVPSPWLGTRHHELYLPMPVETLQGDRASHSFPVIARLSDGVDKESAQADMDRITRELATEYPRSNTDWNAQVFTVHEYLYGSAGGQLGLILAAAGLVLLIACANVAGLQLARAAGRETELAVRTALGASRWAMVRMLFSESMLLASLGGLLGVGVAYVAVDALKALLPPTMPRIDEVHVDASTVVFALAAAGVTALAFGMLPALLASRSDLASGVREGGRGTLAPKKERLRDYFIVGQIALGLVLVNGAGLLVRSYTELKGQAYGFDTDVLALSLNPNGPRYEDAGAGERYIEQVAEEVAAIPGVQSVGMVSRLPLAGGSNGNVQVEGWPPRASSSEGPLVEVTSVVGDYFETMGIPLLQGRTLIADDSITDAIGAVINSAMAEEVWPGESPLGKRFGFGDPPPWLTVVGVVGDVRQWGPEQPALAQAYLPYAQGWSTGGNLVVRAGGDPARLVADIRRAVLAVDGTQPPSDIRAMGERLERAFAQRRFYTTLIALFAVAALFLAAAGVYGTVSYFVARRTRELGIRMALGAGGGGIVGLVVQRGVRLALWGVGVGLLGVWGTVKIARSLVYGVSATDPLSLLVGGVVLAGVAVVASALPATRATRVRPSIALRTEA